MSGSYFIPIHFERAGGTGSVASCGASGYNSGLATSSNLAPAPPWRAKTSPQNGSDLGPAALRSPTGRARPETANCQQAQGNDPEGGQTKKLMGWVAPPIPTRTPNKGWRVLVVFFSSDAVSVQNHAKNSSVQSSSTPIPWSMLIVMECYRSQDDELTA